MTAEHTFTGLVTNSFYADDMTAAKCYAELLGIDAYFTSSSTENAAFIEFCIGYDEQDFLPVETSVQM